MEGDVEGVGGAMEGGLRPQPQLQAAMVAVRQQVKEEAGYEVVLWRRSRRLCGASGGRRAGSRGWRRGTGCARSRS